MTGFQLASAILRGVWAIDEKSAKAHTPIIMNILNGDNSALGVMEDTPFNIAAVDKIPVVEYSRRDGFASAEKGSVALIGLQGPLMKGDQMCGPLGMATIGGRIREANTNDNISAIVLVIDSPGGTVDGTEMLANIVSDVSKPVVSFVDGLMASAALWIGICADEVIASTDMDIIGSIGVMTSFADLQPKLEREGVRFHDILADQSKDKNRIFSDVLTGKYAEYKEKVLNPIAERFINHVKAKAPNVGKKHLTGSTFFAKDLKGVFVDSIGDLDSAIIRANDLATKEGSYIKKKKGTPTFLEKKEENKPQGKKEPEANNNNHKKNNIMTRQELKSQHPDLYAEIFKEGQAAERDRVCAFMAFSESSPEAVKKHIEAGDEFTNTVSANLSVAMTKHALNAQHAEGNTPPVKTPEAPKKTDAQIASETAEKELLKSLEKQGLTVKK